jgi:probable phosphoglycerate mutase
MPAPALERRPFWFLRHGETDWNAQGLSQGNVDVPLNANGISQAREAAALLRNRGIVTMVSSPLSRARVTAEIVAAVLGLSIAFDDALKEVAFGVQEGQPMATWFDEWVEGRVTPEGAETFASLRMRGVAAANRALGNPAPVLIVSHGALFRGLRAEMGLPANVRTPNGVPFLCAPGAETGAPWTLTPVSSPDDQSGAGAGGMTNRR